MTIAVTIAVTITTTTTVLLQHRLQFYHVTVTIAITNVSGRSQYDS